MISFLRNKTVGTERLPGGSYLAWGFLSDDIYGVRLKVEVDPDSYCIIAIEGEFDRYTTPECPKALPLLDTARGMDIRLPDLNRRINKQIGRAACEHFASLLIECSSALRGAMLADGWEEAKKADPGLSLAQYAAGEAGRQPHEAPAPGKAVEIKASPAARQAPPDVQAAKAHDGFIMDLHIHSFPASACATDPIEAMLARARELGLDGVCLTDHNYIWDQQRAAELGREYGLLVLTGTEITTVQGDIVVFGYDQAAEGMPTAAELAEAVRAAGGLMIAAHPFRGFRTVGSDQLGLTVDMAKQRPLFSLVDAIEAANSKVTGQENGLAASVAQALDLPAVGGSDAHSAGEVGLFATRFTRPISTVAELIKAIRAGEGGPVSFGNEQEQAI